MQFRSKAGRCPNCGGTRAFTLRLLERVPGGQAQWEVEGAICLNPACTHRRCPVHNSPARRNDSPALRNRSWQTISSVRFGYSQ